MRVPNWALAAGLAGVVALGAGSTWASGGSGGGGSTAPVSAPATTSTAGCVTIPVFRNTTGYYAIWAAIWTDFTISDKCGVPVDWRLDYTNKATGIVEFSRGTSTAYMSTGTIDYDWGSFSSNYDVSLKVTLNGKPMASINAGVATKKPKDLLTTVSAAARSADATAAAALVADQAAAAVAATATATYNASETIAVSDATAAMDASAAALAPDSAAAAAATSVSDLQAAIQMGIDVPTDAALVAAADLAATALPAGQGIAADMASRALPFDNAATAAHTTSAASTLVANADRAIMDADDILATAAHQAYLAAAAAAAAADATYAAILAASLV